MSTRNTDQYFLYDLQNMRQCVLRRSAAPNEIALEARTVLKKRIPALSYRFPGKIRTLIPKAMLDQFLQIPSGRRVQPATECQSERNVRIENYVSCTYRPFHRRPASSQITCRQRLTSGPSPSLKCLQQS